MRRRAPLALLFAAVVTYVYRPWEMVGRLPRDTADTGFVTFTMAWIARSVHHPSGVFNAPIFWPHHNTLTYSDPVMPLGLVWGVVHRLGGSWTIATGVVVMVMVVANLGATYALAKRLTGRADAAALAAFAFALSDFALSQWGHIQMQALAYLPLGFLLLLRVLEHGRWLDGLLLGLLQVAMVLTTASIALAWIVAAGAAIAVHVVLRRGRLQRSVWTALVLAGVVFLAIGVPVTRPYARLQDDPNFRRPLRPAASTRWPDMFTPSRRREDPLRFLEVVPRVGRYAPEHEAFPGLTTLALGAVGLGVVAAAGRRRTQRQHELLLIGAAGAACLLTAVGPNVLGPVSPYRILHNDVPGFAGLCAHR